MTGNEQSVVYARLSTGSRLGWLKLLAAGWGFADETKPTPMVGHHGAFAVLMVRDSVTIEREEA